MRPGSLATRKTAIPFRANWYDQASVGNAFPDVWPYADLYNLKQGITGYIRLAIPAAGDLVQCRLTLQALNTTASTSIRLAIGRFAANGISVDTTMTAVERAKSHRALTGGDAALVFPAGTPILIDGLDLLKAMLKEGATGYNRDGLVLHIEITSANLAGWTLAAFKVDGSVQMGVL